MRHPSSIQLNTVVFTNSWTIFMVFKLGTRWAWTWAGRGWWSRWGTEREWHWLFTISLPHSKLVLLVQSNRPFIERIVLCFLRVTCSFRFSKNFWANLGLSERVDLHTLVKFQWVMTFWETAMVSVRFMTACQTPPGTNTVSPGLWINYWIPSSYLEYLYLIFGRISTK